ncbi:hypothetical protein [Neobacillus ginsengisoli]|uniref:Uncharacterized protein n=1 Tax=Neobacillus ginsengisoli TaxID=904295 RepID=A0ABT9XQW7_9BACI|nr:hypothetical protein [Neobacillus ginsengisoli]MDQ0197945.1 hypothetical protein [Neobacillus ginsengisoli]
MDQASTFFTVYLVLWFSISIVVFLYWRKVRVNLFIEIICSIVLQWAIVNVALRSSALALGIQL